MDNFIEIVLKIFAIYIGFLFVFAIIFVIYFQILTQDKKENDFNKLEKRNSIICHIFSALATIIFIYCYHISPHDQIGGIFEEDWYTKYYVYLFYDKNDTKNYRLPALAYRNDGNYFVEEIYWPNGNVLYLDDEVTPNKMCEVEDSNYNTYYIILSNEKINDNTLK